MSSCTLCEHCIFCETNQNEQQTGCSIIAHDNKSRLDIFQELNLVELQDNGKFKINSYCNTCRNVYWQPYIDCATIPHYLESKVRQETKVTYSVLINITDSTIQDIHSIIHKVNDFNIPPLEIVLFGKLSEENAKKYECFFQNPKIKISLSVWDDVFQQCADAARKTKGDYFLFLTPGIEPDFSPEKLEYDANDKLLPTLHCIHDTYYLVLSYVYKAYMYEKNPIVAISQGLIKNDESKSECSNSKL